MCEPRPSLQGGGSILREGSPIVQEISLATKVPLKASRPWNKTGARTFRSEQGRLCVAIAAET